MSLASTQVGVDIKQQGQSLVVEFLRSSLPATLRRRLDEHALQLPHGLKAEPAVLEGTVAPKSRHSFKIKLTADATTLPAGVQMVPMDITLDGRRYGQLFDFIIQAKP